MKLHPWYDPDVCDPTDYPSGKPDPGLPWLRILIVAIIGIIIAACL